MQICICRVRVEYVKLEEICTIVSGGTPSRSKSDYWNNGNIPWIKIKDMKSKYIDSAEEFITEEGLNNSSTKMLKSDTILYSIFATLGEVGILKIDACTNQAIAGLSLKEDSNILKEYLYYYLKSKKKDVNNLGRGVAQNNINLSLSSPIFYKCRFAFNHEIRICRLLYHPNFSLYQATNFLCDSFTLF